MLEDLLAEAQSRGWIGKAPLADAIAHAAGFAACVTQPPALWVDLGSGGGVPGLVLAQLWPETRGLLVDSSAHRAEFLSSAVKSLALDDRIEVLHERAELTARRDDLRAQCDVVTARGFAIPPATAECAAPLLRLCGELVVSEPPSGAASSTRWRVAPLAALGLEPTTLFQARFTYQLLTQRAECPPQYPRRPGIPEKRPLF